MPLGIDVGFSLQRAPSALVEYALGRDARSNGSLRRLFIQMQLLLYPCHQVHWCATSSLQVPHFLPSGHIDHGLVGRSTVMSHQTNVTMTTVFFCNRAIISTVPSSICCHTSLNLKAQYYFLESVLSPISGPLIKTVNFANEKYQVCPPSRGLYLPREWRRQMMGLHVWAKGK